MTSAAASQRRTFNAMASRLKETRQSLNPTEIIRQQDLVISQLEEQLARALERERLLNEECDWLAAQAKNVRQRDMNGEDTPRLVNQQQAAKILGVKQYNISRWMKHFETEVVEGRAYPLIVASSLHIPATSRIRGRKKAK